MGRLEAECSWKSKQQPSWTIIIHGNLSESSSCGEEEPPGDGGATGGWRGKGLRIWMDRASDAGLKAWGARGVGRKQQSTDHFPVAILVNQLIFSCFRLVRVTIAVTKEPHLCILYSHEHNDVRFLSFFKQRPYCKSPISLLQVLYRYILICHTLSTLTPTPENINEGETHWSTLSS